MEQKAAYKKIGVGVCDIFFYPPNGNPVYIGLTNGGATFTYTGSWFEITADQTGNSPLDDVDNGGTAVLEATALDTSLERIYELFPQSKKIEENGEHVATSFGRSPGLRARDYAGKLIAHPIAMGNDDSKDIVIHKTTNTGDLNLAYKLDDMWKVPLKFKGYFDDLREDGDRTFRIGRDSNQEIVEQRIVRFWITPANSC